MKEAWVGCTPTVINMEKSTARGDCKQKQLLRSAFNDEGRVVSAIARAPTLEKQIIARTTRKLSAIYAPPIAGDGNTALVRKATINQVKLKQP
jgi:hypothetical protein